MGLGCQPATDPVGSIRSVFGYRRDNRTLVERIEAGKYNAVYFKSEIVEKKFPIHRPSRIWSPLWTEFKLVCLKKPASTNEVFQSFEERNLLPGWIDDLTTVGEEAPDVQRDNLVVALGSARLAPDGFTEAPFLGNSNGVFRYFSLAQFIDDPRLNDSPIWPESCCFLAIDK